VHAVREGTDWLHKISAASDAGRADAGPRSAGEHLGNIAGKTLCAFGDAAVTPC